MSTEPEQLETGKIDEDAVIAYLRSDPDFFVRQPALLSELNLPHASGRTVSLVEHQVAILRERNVDMRRRMHTLLQTARENDELFTKTRSLTLALLEAGNAQSLNEILATHMLVDFEADFVCCHLPGAHLSLDHLQYHAGALPSDPINSGASILCTTLRREELEALFPLSSHTDTGSAVLLPLPVGSTRVGALCIGSRDPQRFSSDMDTLFVSYIADILSKVIARLEL